MQLSQVSAKGPPESGGRGAIASPLILAELEAKTATCQLLFEAIRNNFEVGKLYPRADFAGVNAGQYLNVALQRKIDNFTEPK